MKFLAQLGARLDPAARLIVVDELSRELIVPAIQLMPLIAGPQSPRSEQVELRTERWEIVSWKRGTVTAKWWLHMGFDLGDGWSKRTHEQELTWGIYRRAACRRPRPCCVPTSSRARRR